MSNAAVRPDAVVRTALQVLPVPAHADDFWTRVEANLDLEVTTRRPIVAPPIEAVVAMPPSPPDEDPARAVVPASLRRRSNVVLLGVAAAALVVVALAGSTLLEARSDSQPIAADGPAAVSEELDALVDDAQLGPGPLAALSAEQTQASSAAVLAWVEDVRAGDAEEAWAAMGTESQAHFGSLAAFEADLAEVADDHGGWAEAPGQVVVTPVPADDDAVVAVVTLLGSVTGDGETMATDAVPVRLADGDARVEPYAPVGQLELVVPAPSLDDDGPATVEAGDELMLVVPAGAEPPVLRLDDGSTVICGETDGTELIPLEELPGQRCSYLPAAAIEAGIHTLTVAYLGSGGAAISAESLLFEVA